MASIPRNPDIWFSVDDLFPGSIEELAAQIKHAARARRDMSFHHPNSCECNGCRVRRIHDFRQRMAERDAARAAARTGH